MTHSVTSDKWNLGKRRMIHWPNSLLRSSSHLHSQQPFSQMSATTVFEQHNVYKLFSNLFPEKLQDELHKPEVVKRIKYETSDAFRLDESKRPKNDAPQMYTKLNVD